MGKLRLSHADPGSLTPESPCTCQAPSRPRLLASQCRARHVRGAGDADVDLTEPLISESSGGLGRETSLLCGLHHGPVLHPARYLL